FCTSLDQSLDHVVWFVPVEQFQMEVAARFVGEALEKFPRQPEAKCARHVLLLFRCAEAFELQFVQTTPNQMWSSAEINDASRQTFIHGHISFAGGGMSRIKACAVPANASLLSESRMKRLTKRNATVLDRVMRIHLEVAFA